MLDQKKPPLEELAHYGVRGMRWGVRRSDAQLKKATAGRKSSKPKKQKSTKPKPTSAEIRNARVLTESRRRDVNHQIVKANVATGKKKAQEVAKVDKKLTDLANSPDTATALRFTTGEKVAVGIAAVALPVVGVLAGGAVVGSRVRTRHKLEKQQENNK